MKRFFALMLAVLLCWGLSFALAYSVPYNTVVYVTDTGYAYHRWGCPHLKSSHPLTIQEAEGRGYWPCSRCDPDVLTGQYIPSGENHSSGSNKSGVKPATREAASTDQNTSITSAKPIDWSGIITILVAFWPITLYLGWKCVRLITWPVRAWREREKPAKAPESSRERVAAVLPEQTLLPDKDLPEATSRTSGDREKYIALYEHKAPIGLVAVPPGTELGPDELPKIKGTKGWGKTYTVYISKSGKCFHQRRGCSGATTPIHLWNAHYRRSACSICCNDLPNLDWYAEYVRIKGIKEMYRIE